MSSVWLTLDILGKKKKTTSFYFYFCDKYLLNDLLMTSFIETRTQNLTGCDSINSWTSLERKTLPLTEVKNNTGIAHDCRKKYLFI